MPTPATLNPAMGTSGGTAQTTAGAGQPVAPVIVKPFTRASNEHRESIGFDKSLQITTSDQDLGATAIPAYGYLRALVVVVTATGGVGGVLSADGPFSLLKNIAIQEPNGATISQFNQGWDLYAANKYGGYRGYNDPKSSPVYSASANPSFVVRIPLEMNNRSSLGALPNQNSAAAFQLRMTMAAIASVYSTAPTTAPTFRIRVYAEEWDQPAPSSDGTANATTPPAMNTTQYWSEQVYPISAGQQTIRLTRVGNFIRNLLFVYRDTTGARVTVPTNWPDTTQLFLDTRPLDTIQESQWRHTTYERQGYGGAIGATVPPIDSPRGLDSGLYPYDFCHEFNGSVGFELNDNWLPTLSSTRLEIQGNFGVAGTLTVVTNDISPAGNVFLNG